jgi:transposase
MSHRLRAFLRALKPLPPVRFETAMGEQMQVDWVEFCRGTGSLHVFCTTLGYSRANYVCVRGGCRRSGPGWILCDSDRCGHVW